MDALEIAKIAAGDWLFSQQFLGVFAANEIPAKIRPGKMLIANCCRRGLPGRHWILIYQKNLKICLFLDSYGLHPKFYGFTKHLPKMVRLRYNTVQFQSLGSNSCALYCLFFGYNLVRNRTFEEIVHNFTADFPNNDRLVEQAIKKQESFFQTFLH